MTKGKLRKKGNEEIKNRHVPMMSNDVPDKDASQLQATAQSIKI